jgi:uncharacterized protein (TIGR02246 family)
MKKVLTITIFLLIGGSLFAQYRTKDEAAINAVVDAMIYSWNHHNYDDLKNYTTENTDFVNVVGMWWKGRKESQYAHQAYHNTMFKTAVCERTSVAIRFATNDVAIVHLIWRFSDPHPQPFPDGKPANGGPTDAIATIVCVQQEGKWLMDAIENVTIDKGAAPYDPVLKMPKN